jgi:LysR family transcriptional regulator of beta-lactamase
MTRSYLPLNSLRAFEAAARHLSFTHAAIELNVTHSAISQHVKALEQHLNCQLFVRVSRGLMLTTEGENLLPVLNDSFDRIAGMLDRFASQRAQEKLKLAWWVPLLRGVILAARGLSSLLSAYRSSAFDA